MRPHAESSAGSTATVLLLKGMNGAAPAASTAVVLALLGMPCRPDTWATWKWAAVVSSSGRKKVVSWAVHPLISALVTMLVLTPHRRWTLTHSRLSVSLPYFL